MRKAYIRVSTTDQNTERQLDGIQYDLEYVDKCSGAIKDRPKLTELLYNLAPGDEVVVHDISRCARNVAHLLEIVEEVKQKGASIEFMKEHLKFGAGANSATQDLYLTVLGAVYEFERSMMKERQREGIEKAKAKGVYKGRPAKVDKDAIIDLLKDGVSMRKTAEKLKVGLSTVQRAKQEAGI